MSGYGMKMVAYLLLALVSLTLFVHDANAEDIFHVALPFGITDTSDPLCNKCHTVLFKDDKAILAQNIKPNIENYDSLTLSCIGCHDGNTAKNAPISILNACSSKSAARNICYDVIKNHPILIRYPYEKKEFRSLQDILPGKWNGAIIVNDLLRDGKIVCISCHIPHHTRETGYLRTLNNGSSLCLGCHKK